jgi:hypothetical protein
VSKVIKMRDRDGRGEPTLARWTRGVYMSGGRKPERFELRHDSQSGEHRVDGWDAESVAAQDMSPDQLAEVILERAQEDAAHYRGPQKYAVVVYRENGDGTYDARTFLRCQGGNPDLNDTIEETEAPNERGQTSQMMRHNEALMRMHLEGTREMMRFMKDIASEVRAENMHLRQREKDTIDAYAAFQDKRDERALAMKREALKEKMADQMFDKANILIPIALGKLLGTGGGGKDGKGSPHVEAAVFQDVLFSLFKSFDQEQIAAITMGEKPIRLRPEQMAGFHKIYETLKDAPPSKLEGLVEAGADRETLSLMFGIMRGLTPDQIDSLMLGTKPLKLSGAQIEAFFKLYELLSKMSVSAQVKEDEKKAAAAEAEAKAKAIEDAKKAAVPDVDIDDTIEGEKVK